MSVRIEKGKTIRAIAYDLTVMTRIMMHVDENIMRAMDLPTRVHYLVVPPRALASRGYFTDLASGQKRRPGVGVEAGDVLDGICEDGAFCSVEVREKRVNDGIDDEVAGRNASAHYSALHDDLQVGDFSETIWSCLHGIYTVVSHGWSLPAFSPRQPS